jgi:hypothetical protein
LSCGQFFIRESCWVFTAIAIKHNPYPRGAGGYRDYVQKLIGHVLTGGRPDDSVHHIREVLQPCRSIKEARAAPGTRTESQWGYRGGEFRKYQPNCLQIATIGRSEVISLLTFDLDDVEIAILLTVFLAAWRAQKYEHDYPHAVALERDCARSERQ